MNAPFPKSTESQSFYSLPLLTVFPTRPPHPSGCLFVACGLFAFALAASGAPSGPLATDRPPISSPRNLVLSSEVLRHLSPSSGPSKRLTVYSLDPSQRAVATNTIDSASARPQLIAGKNQIHIIASEFPGATSPAALSKGKVNLPSKIGLTREESNNDVTLAVGDLFLNALETPLRWDSKSNAYLTTLAIGLDFEKDPGMTELPFALTFQLLTQNASVDQAEIAIKKIGPSYQHVTLTCKNGRANASVTAHHPKIQDKPLQILCALELGDLVLLSATKKIFGYGLGTTKLTLTRQAMDRFDFFDTNEIKVAVRSGLGKLDCGGSVTIAPHQANTEFELRSLGTGLAEITASYGPFHSTEQIYFAFPYAFFLAAILGGCLGGCGRIFRQGKADFQRKRKWIIEGAVAGFIIVGATAAGIVIFSLPTAVVGTELGAFVIASISGYIGSHVLDRLPTGVKT